jgi:NAD(P)-dependent dehydrogenase (short-subunit alcohol dehydrogenase family)
MQANVGDADAWASLIRGLYRSYGRIDAVIHAAGIIEDKLHCDKSAASFARVFDTKADSAFVLARELNPETVKLLVFFSSVAGSFGSRGQCDYTAANGLLNALATHLDRRWGGRVVAINWGPWGDVGMASAPEVQRQFLERGIPLVRPSAGRRAFDDELRRGRKGDSVVVWGSGPQQPITVSPTVPPSVQTFESSL